MRRATFSERKAQEEEELQRKTFTEADDSELSSALSRRITQVSGSYDGTIDEPEPEQTPPLEGRSARPCSSDSTPVCMLLPLQHSCCAGAIALIPTAQ